MLPYHSRNSPDPSAPEPTDVEERAAWLAAAHADTPQVVISDNLGRPFVTIDDNGTDGLYTMTTDLDIKGNPQSITDAKGRTSFTYLYDMLNRPLKTTHLDNGSRYALNNVIGNPLRAFDSRNQIFRFTYDELLRPIGTYVQESANPETLVNFTVYGERRNNPQNRNLRGQPYLIYDSSGLTENFRFDFKGNLLRVQKQLALDYTQAPDWTALDSINGLNALRNAGALLLEAEVFLTVNNYDALNRPRRIRTPDSTRIIPRYDEGGQLRRINTRIRNAAPAIPHVKSITYNARGQRDRIRYGNDVVTRYTYDEKTFRLARLRTTRNSGADVLQDLLYTYDPVGNITTLRDDAQQTIFFDNQQVEPDGKYEYDALYRLTQAEGREKRNLGGAPGPGEIGIQPVPSGQNTAVRGYTEQYNYDELGNMLQIIHTSTRTQDSWNKYYHYTPAFTNNFLQSTSTDNVAPTNPDYTYDAHGSMTQMPHLSSMSWDFADRLQSADIGGNAMVYFTYDANGERVRKVRVNASGRRWERIYLGPFEIYRIVNGNGNLRFERQTLHISDNQSRVALVDTLTVENGNTIANPVSVQRYQLNNHLESASLELDENADIISYEEFYPFGSTSYRAGRSNSEVNAKRYRYVGKEKDNETGLYYYGARYYASWLARFVSVDPLKDEYPFYTSYQYAGNKPITFIDLDGLEEAKPPLFQLQRQFQSFLQKSKNVKPVNPFKQPVLQKSDNTRVSSGDDRRAFIQSQVDKKQAFEQQKIDLANGNFSSFLNAQQNPRNNGTIRAASTDHPGVGTDLQKLAKSPVIRGFSSGILLGFTAAEIGGSQAVRTVAKPFVQRFVRESFEQLLANTIRDFNETGKVTFEPGQIDLANSLIAAAAGIKTNNKKFEAFKPLLEEALKAGVDFDINNGFDPKKLDEFANEFGLRLAFKFIPTNSKDAFGENQLNASKQLVLEVSKKVGRGEIQEAINNDKKK